jgi:hypothetical protein
MKEIDTLFSFPINYDEEGNVEINNLPNYPQENKNSQKLYERLELLKIDESGLSFPTRLKKWTVIINPINKETIIKYFKIDGIKMVVEENKSKLKDKITFVKPQILYNKKAKYPNLIIHFYQVDDEDGVFIIDEFDLIDYTQIIYTNTKQFTAKRIIALEQYVNCLELLQIPLIPIEMVKFDEDNKIIKFESHELSKKASELPF